MTDVVRTRPAPSRREPVAGGASVGGALFALATRDLGGRRALRWPLLLDLAFGVVNLLVYLFISRVVAPARGHPALASGSYFDFVAVGIVFMLVIQAGTSHVTKRVAREQRSGTLEMLAAQPLSSSTLAVGLALHPLFFALARALVYLGLLAAFFHLDVGRADWWGVAVLLTLSSAAVLGVGIALAAFGVAVGHGEITASLVTVGLAFVSGTYFPVSALPGPLPDLTAVLPTRIALDGLRAAVAGEPWAGSAGALLLSAVLLLPLSCWAFGQALRIGARRGTLTRE
ncbi:ABC transporter permease [Micromonospora humi]|uniref:Transport permease protein n=1 Tax=Micromonospora humi TaxID=745366 RepID=A0A1C5IJ26_9ACTN|nr:ABC transporter permease [Micromonospora humi]SCG58093.1 ABC-type multidrug transport system, permease component [Micromonospora humi]